MRKTLILLLLIFVAAGGGSAQTRKKISRIKKKAAPVQVKPAAANSANMNGEMTITLKQEAIDSASGIKIGFVEFLEDSRCPEGVNCIWAGSAKIRISVSKNGASGQTIELNTGIEPRSVVYQGYTIALTGVAPYPKDGVDSSAEKTQASFMITK